MEETEKSGKANSKLEKNKEVVDEEFRDMDPAKRRELAEISSSIVKMITYCPKDSFLNRKIISFTEFTAKYNGMKEGTTLEDVTINLGGRLGKKKHVASKLYHFTLHSNQDKAIQLKVIADARNGEWDKAFFSRFHSSLNHGDIIGVSGYPGKNERGELSLFSTYSTCLSRKLNHKADAYAKLFRHPTGGLAVGIFPKSFTGSPVMHNQKAVLDADAKKSRCRLHFLDILTNMDAQEAFMIYSKIIFYARKFLSRRDILEVKSSTMNTTAGGIVARTIVTQTNGMSTRLDMHPVPARWLKRLDANGLDRIYEMTRHVPNGGIDSTQNLELTTCEIYMISSDYNHLMELVEQMLSGMVKRLTGAYKIKCHVNGPEKDPVEIDFTPPFRRISMIEQLEKMTNLNIPRDFSSDITNKCLIEACIKYGIDCPHPQTTAHLLDKLVGHFLVDMCVNPTFIIDHPMIMSPFARCCTSSPGLTERFELLINKHEVCNGYVALNDPAVYRKRFWEHLKDRRSGHNNVMPFDETFWTALQTEPPPIGAWWLWIDPLTMLLTDSQNIEEVIINLR